MKESVHGNEHLRSTTEVLKSRMAVRDSAGQEDSCQTSEKAQE